MRNIVKISLAMMAAVAVVGCARNADPTAGNLATVNGDTITMEDFYQQMRTKSRVRVQTGQGIAELPVADTLAFQTLQEAVTRRIVLQLAQDEGVLPNDAEILAELNFRKKLNENYVQALTNIGFSLDQIKDAIKLDLATERLVTKGITVPMTEVEQYIKDNPREFREPAVADLLMVFVRSEEKKTQVDQQLRAGQSFSLVATRLSEAQGARENNARYPIRNVSQMPPPVANLVNRTSEGQTTDWIAGDGGWAKFFLEKKTAERPINMTEERKQLLQRRLARLRGEQATDLSRRVADKMVESQIAVQERTLTEAWDRFFERFKRERQVNVPTAEGGAESSAPAAAGTTGN